MGSSAASVSLTPDLPDDVDSPPPHSPLRLSSSSIPLAVPSSDVPSYAQRFKNSLRNLRKISSPVSKIDGFPVVLAPSSVVLQASETWKDYIIAHFHGRCPAPSRIYNNLNPVWGKHGNITIHALSQMACLILIPSEATRHWVLDVGYWQVDNCALTAVPWSQDASLELQELVSAPTWAVLKNVPPQLYSLDGISVIESGIGEPLHTEHSKLPPFHFGDTKVKVEIRLQSLPPLAVIVRDSVGYQVQVNVEYPRLPPKCCNCGKFGHMLKYCTIPIQRKNFSKNMALPRVSKGVAHVDIADKDLEPSRRGEKEDRVSLSDFPLPPSSQPVTEGKPNVAKVAPRIKGFPPFSGKPSLRFLSHRLDKSKKLRLPLCYVPKLAEREPVPTSGNQTPPISQSASPPRIGCLLETKVLEENSLRIKEASFPGWRWENNYSYAAIGRIWVVWDPAISVVVYKKSAQFILCGVCDPSTRITLSVAFVYGFNTEVQRKDLWRELSELNSSTTLSISAWLVIGDFNQILNVGEHYSIQAFDSPIRGMDDLRSFLHLNDLSDLSSRGAYYTWTNCRPEDPILRKLDRAVVNSAWRSQFPDSLATFDPPGDSDHSPCLITLSPVAHSGRKSFKYFSFVSTHSNFLPSLRSAWGESVGTGSIFFTLGQRLKKAKECCKKINREGFGNIQQRTKTALEDLERIQAELLTAPSEALAVEESAARDIWSFFASAQESFFKLKSRIRWLREGDSNTRDSSGLRIYNQQQIKGMTLAYFKQLLGSESRDIEPFSVDRIKEIHPFRCSPHLATDLI
ncbi:Endonuclease/exonuclease/phosphatase protein [Raphanus sativus]|nr:Endonuclease/exonuclease/phosphatase protein [Raphanus sativus]